jgi:hypothetical protein
MGINMKLVGLVILGIASSVAAGILMVILLLLLAAATGNTGPVPVGEGPLLLLIGLLVLSPLSFFLGGIVTGYFSYYDIENKLSLLLMAPALYFNILWMSIAILDFLMSVFISNNTLSIYSYLREISIPVAIGLLWYAVSAAGVFLGYNLREYVAKRWGY